MKVIITGGCGFIGVNTAIKHLEAGDEVVIVDDLSRKGTNINLDLLNEKYKGLFEFHLLDIADHKKMFEALNKHADAAIVYHLAAQVAVTTSVTNPYSDFRNNAYGTFMLLELMRHIKFAGKFIYASTNKVYGELLQYPLVEKETRYEFGNAVMNDKGISEQTQLDPHSPYGCSKYTADAYVHDYNRIYNMNTTVFRQSCIYGPNQMGNEENGWIVGLLIKAIKDEEITIYGDGKQVRDILFAEDLIRAYYYAFERDESAGEIYNIGGGMNNSISLLEFLKIIETKLGKQIKYKFADARPGDQKIFVSDNTKLMQDLGWKPQIEIDKGLDLAVEWAHKIASKI